MKAGQREVVKVGSSVARGGLRGEFDMTKC